MDAILIGSSRSKGLECIFFLSQHQTDQRRKEEAMRGREKMDNIINIRKRGTAKCNESFLSM
ncbi:MAGUK p55 subfamily member 5-A-like [Sesbania bispinosa]|nr:MAGUK p55 subfamily member 5-A-like [Sesbania bispinosa]